MKLVVRDQEYHKVSFCMSNNLWSINFIFDICLWIVTVTVNMCDVWQSLKSQIDVLRFKRFMYDVCLQFKVLLKFEIYFQIDYCRSER